MYIWCGTFLLRSLCPFRTLCLPSSKPTMNLIVLLLWFHLSRSFIAHAAPDCAPAFGTNINIQDCAYAENRIFSSNIAPMSQADFAALRHFKLYDEYIVRRIPQGYEHQSCSIGFDLQDTELTGIFASWQGLQPGMTQLIQECVASRGIGGVNIVDGIVYVIINPQQRTGYGTMLASKRPHRLNLLQSVYVHGLQSPPALASADIIEIAQARNPSMTSIQPQFTLPRPSLPPPPPPPRIPRARAALHSTVVAPATTTELLSGMTIFAPPPMQPSLQVYWFWGYGRWNHYINSANQLNMWRRTGAWGAIKVKGEAEPFPLIIPQVQGLPGKFKLRRPDLRLSNVDRAWIWRSEGDMWLPYTDAEHLPNQGEVPYSKRPSTAQGWFLIKWYFPGYNAPIDTAFRQQFPNG